jgi:ribosomal protein S27E
MKYVRFSDNATYLSEFMRSIAVQCPKCGKEAVVQSDGKFHHRSPATVTCSACGYHEIESVNAWKGRKYGRVKRQCPYCHQWIEKTLSCPQHPYLAELECPRCQVTFQEKVTWYVEQYPPYDPFFSLPLWFCMPVDRHMLWAYNRAHLGFLKQYVSASLRVREPNHNRTLVSRLPKWIKQKNNRQKILKAIERLENRCV